MKIVYNNQKIETEINGLDELLFGGLQLQNIAEESKKKNDCEAKDTFKKPLIVVIQGELGTSRALLAMQLLHGITKSLRALESNSQEGIDIADPVFFTTNKSNINVSDMLVDTVISKCISHIVEENAKGEKGKWKGDLFCRTIFKVPQSINLPMNLLHLDDYLGQEIIEYNSRTNALHVALPSKALSKNRVDNAMCIPRRYDSLGEYIQEDDVLSALAPLDKEFFAVRIPSSKTYLDYYVANLDGKKIPCIVLDKDNAPGNEDTDDELTKNSLVVIYIKKHNTELEDYNADLIIEMRSHTDPDNEYVNHQLSIRKSVLQDTAHGWHLYKKRDYGFEVYPSLHVILQRRRHMPKGVLRAQLDILSKTYQHFIDEQKNFNSISTLANFLSITEQHREENLKGLYENFSRGECPEDILQNILVGNNDSKCQVTAIIGPANTYKRHLMLGGTFSASCRGEHTLNILLDKEDNIILQKMICPATIFRTPKDIINKKCASCIGCYKCIHFKEIRMGCISSDEFFYYLIQQLRVSNESVDESQRIRRIVIDDLQKIEFCFPMIRKDSLFLTGLISICKDYDVDLFILCDKSSEIVQALRAQADNVICTERTPDYDLNIYIEHYSGPSSPSHIWACHVTNIKDLFYCDVESGCKRYRLNEKSIRNFSVYSMEDYWKK